MCAMKYMASLFEFWEAGNREGGGGSQDGSAISTNVVFQEFLESKQKKPHQ